MNKIIRCFIMLTTLIAFTHAHARDDQKMFSIKEALESPAAKDKLDPDIKLYFGNQKHPAIVKSFGEARTNKKTNGFNKSDQQACEWTFIGAVLALQNNARQQGGNAVVGIKSNYRNIEKSSNTEYMCGSGALMSGVALKGKVVKLAK